MNDRDRKILEFVGFLLHGNVAEDRWWLNGQYYGNTHPPIDLNFLAEYVFPKLDGYMIFTGEEGVPAIMSLNGLNYVAINPDLLEACLQAVEQAIGGK